MKTLFLPFQLWQNEEISVSGPKIPQALEKILQLKEIRQEQLTDPTGQYSLSPISSSDAPGFAFGV